jgi:hypothetical protein
MEGETMHKVCERKVHQNAMRRKQQARKQYRNEESPDTEKSKPVHFSAPLPPQQDQDRLEEAH